MSWVLILYMLAPDGQASAGLAGRMTDPAYCQMAGQTMTRRLAEVHPDTRWAWRCIEERET